MSYKRNLNVVGPQIRLLRLRRNWTQQHLAKMVCELGWKLTRGTIAKMETTELRVTDCDLLLLAKALDVSVGEFFSPRYQAPTKPIEIQSCRLIRGQRVRNPRSCTQRLGTLSFYRRRII